jgi:hypothetical protein
LVCHANLQVRSILTAVTNGVLFTKSWLCSERTMITVAKFGTFFVVYCNSCGRHDYVDSVQEAEHLRDRHECVRQPVFRIDLVPQQFACGV